MIAENQNLRFMTASLPESFAARRPTANTIIDA
jgi:hypothetical protein